MDKKEAIEIIDSRLEALESLGYQQLSKRIDDIEAYDFEAPSGVTYNIEIQFFWDDQPNGVIRVAGNIDNGGIRAFYPLTSSRLVGPAK